MLDEARAREQVNRTVSVRQLDADSDKQDMGEMQVDDFIELLRSSDNC